MHRCVAGCATGLVAVSACIAHVAASELAVCGGGGTGAPEIHVSLGALTEPERVQRSICEWFEGEPWRVRFVTGEPAARASALSVVVKLRGPREAELHFADGSAETERRELTLPGGLDETGLEIIAQVIHSSAEARAERATHAPATGLDVPAPAPRETSPAVSKVSLNLSGGFHAYARGAEPTTFGPGVLAELGWAVGSVHVGVSLRGALWTSTTKRSSDLELSMRGATGQCGISVKGPLGSLVGRAALGAGADFSYVDVRVRDVDTVRRLPFSSRPRPFVAGELGLQRRVWQLDIAAAALLRWQLLASHYQVQDQDGVQTILRPWRLQPGALIEIGHTW